MGKYVSDSATQRIVDLMFRGFGRTPAEEFLKKEMTRYVPQFTKKTDEEIRNFVEYQRAVYLLGAVPIIGRPIASLNPTFIDSVKSIRTEILGTEVYTRASIKENGYRFQMHIGPGKVAAFTRQFTSYDLRMFPELFDTIVRLPVMVGDAELINKRYKHLAGFNRVEKRIPGVKFWPNGGRDKLSDQLIEEYFSNSELFDENGQPFYNFKLTLSFHGLYAISDPDTWHLRLEEQAKNIITLCPLPVDYRKVDRLLDKLQNFLVEYGLNARVVERKTISKKKELSWYVTQKEKEGLEGVCVVQSAWNDNEQPSFEVGKSVKIKRYETLDAILMGIYLTQKDKGLVEENIAGGLLGLFDDALGMYLPAFKVNFNPEALQIKTAGQKERLTMLRKQLMEVVAGKIQPEFSIPTLYDVFMRQGKIMLGNIFKNGDFFNLDMFFFEMPRGRNIAALWEQFRVDREAYERNDIQKPKVADKFIMSFLPFFQALSNLDRPQFSRIIRYFSQTPTIKRVSDKLIKPQLVLDVRDPIIMEARVFDIKWALCPYAAGFHAWYCNSFNLSNVFAERIRSDKNTTTEYETIYAFARNNTVKKKSRLNSR